MDQRRRVREFVQEKVRFVNQRDIDLDDHQSILLSGLLNSLSMVEVILFIEREFGVDIATGDIQIEDFDTVDSICALLDRTPAVDR
jgi:acyl carrier protein